ncbi:MAG: carboxypeptidase-like regulatory domain-containing protein [Acidobacteria bacterium]|nr:carboxypeptidase-like regulatory domain-containing protein [Acidobacteriota bacterium]
MFRGISVRAGAFFSVVCFLAVVFCGQNFLFAQTTGTILGTVKDQSGAVLPGAALQITNVETGNVRTSVTGGRGEYRLPALSVGT